MNTQLNYPAFLLCKPDIFLRKLLPQFLTFLEDQGFTIKNYLVGRVNENHFRLMYTNHFRADVDDWHHNRKIYNFGPALGLLVENKDPCTTLHKLINLKGSALPRDRKPHSIRYLFGSKSRLFNLIHVSDTDEQSQTEAVHWFGYQISADNQPIAKEEVIHEIDEHSYLTVCSLDPEYAFIKAKIRLMHAMQKKHVCTNHILAQIHTLKLFYSSWAEEVATSSLYNGIEGTILFSRYEKEQELLRAFRSEESAAASIVRAIDFCLYILQNPKFATNFFWLLEEWDVFISELEHYLIASRLKYN